MWTYRVISNTGYAVKVIYTKPDGSTFIKNHLFETPLNIDDLSNFINNHIADIIILNNTYLNIQPLIGNTSNLTTDWNYSMLNVNMMDDWIEIFVEVKNSLYSLPKMYSITQPRSIEYVQQWMQSEAIKLTNWIDAKDNENLSLYFGQEVIL